MGDFFGKNFDYIFKTQLLFSRLSFDYIEKYINFAMLFGSTLFKLSENGDLKTTDAGILEVFWNYNFAVLFCNFNSKTIQNTSLFF